MNDVIRKQPLEVSTYAWAGPYIRVPFVQLDEVVKLLSEHRIRHTVDENVISLDEGPEIAFVDLGQGGDAKHVQQILDSHA